jgi:hypothetical protein
MAIDVSHQPIRTVSNSSALMPNHPYETTVITRGSSAIKMEATGLSTMQLRQQMPALANKLYLN